MRYAVRSLTVLLFSGILCFSFLVAQSGENTDERMYEFLRAEELQREQLEPSLEGPELPPDETLDALQKLKTLDEDTAQTFFAALREQYEYKITGFRHRKNVFRWQFYSSIAIFAMVLFLVAAGVYFSWIQFQRDLQVADSKDKGTELQVSTEGIKIQSSVLGVIILVVSLAFFYLYLVYVYPIQEIL